MFDLFEKIDLFYNTSYSQLYKTAGLIKVPEDLRDEILNWIIPIAHKVIAEKMAKRIAEMDNDAIKMKNIINSKEYKMVADHSIEEVLSYAENRFYFSLGTYDEEKGLYNENKYSFFLDVSKNDDGTYRVYSKDFNKDVNEPSLSKDDAINIIKDVMYCGGDTLYRFIYNGCEEKFIFKRATLQKCIKIGEKAISSSGNIQEKKFTYKNIVFTVLFCCLNISMSNYSKKNENITILLNINPFGSSVNIEDINDYSEVQIIIDELKISLNHELIHLVQDAVLSNHGYPFKHPTSSEFDYYGKKSKPEPESESEPALEPEQIHVLRDVEFYSNLDTFLNFFKNIAKYFTKKQLYKVLKMCLATNSNYSVTHDDILTDIYNIIDRRTYKGSVAIKPEVINDINYIRARFIILKNQPKKYKKAVKLFTKSALDIIEGTI